MEDVGFAYLGRVRPNVRSAATGSPRRRRWSAPGRDAGPGPSAAPPAASRPAGPACARSRRGPAGSRPPGGVVGLQLLVDGGQRGGGAGHRDRASDARLRTALRHARGNDLARGAGQRLGLVVLGRVAGQVALGLAHRAQARGHMEVRCAPGRPTTYSVLPPPMSITSTGRRRHAPAVAPRNVRRASSSPGMIAQLEARAARAVRRGTPGRCRRRAWRWWPRPAGARRPDRRPSHR